MRNILHRHDVDQHLWSEISLHLQVYTSVLSHTSNLANLGWHHHTEEYIHCSLRGTFQENPTSRSFVLESRIETPRSVKLTDLHMWCTFVYGSRRTRIPHLALPPSKCHSVARPRDENALAMPFNHSIIVKQCLLKCGLLDALPDRGFRPLLSSFISLRCLLTSLSRPSWPTLAAINHMKDQSPLQ